MDNDFVAQFNFQYSMAKMDIYDFQICIIFANTPTVILCNKNMRKTPCWRITRLQKYDNQ